MALKITKKLLFKTPRLGTQTNSYIVIHNVGGGGAQVCYNTFEDNCGPSPEAGRKNICCHYTIDDKLAYQMLEDNWKGQHTRGDGHYAKWGKGVSGVNNSNSIGIEVGDGSKVDANKAIENAIELTRHLMQCYNIPLSNVVRHGDTQDKGCPETIMRLNKWQYMLDEIKKRNQENKPINLDTSELTTANMTNAVGGSDENTTGDSSGGTLTITFHDTTTTQESLPNANVSDNWVDMHKIKGVTLHMYPPYHDCTADSMVKYFGSLGWDRNFHYKVDKDTKVDFSKKPVSGQTSGGNIVGSSLSDFEVKPKDPLYSGVVIGGGGGISTDTTDSSASVGDTIEGNDIAHKIYNYCVAQGCSMAAAAGIVGNAECESSFNPKDINSSSGATGLFQWLGGRLTSLKNKASKAGKDWSDVDIQIQHMWAEFSGEEKTTVALLKSRVGGLDKFKKLSNAYTAGYEFGKCFERGGYNEKRGQVAEKWYKKFKEESGGKSRGIMLSVAPVLLAETEVEEELIMPFGWPVPAQTYIQSYFGYRTDNYGYNYHPGIDIVNYAGNGAYCYANGTVKTVLTDTKLNGYVRIDHGNGVSTIYGSLDDIYVKENEQVIGGQCIGITSTTGANELMHLHFGMMIDDEYVDPLDYVEPGGGNRMIPPSLSGFMFANVSSVNDYMTWDKVDKGKICFASADNNTHTYIDANMFNNQHPKYTLSVGGFFYDEFDLVEKTGKVNYPAFEKVLIKQCAKTLYDEGFTSEQLWREFDLNRAPSPFLYLDKDKWIAFCEQVDAQIKWLNTKYGKVTAQYIPNQLLENGNKNEFVETAPDGGIQAGGGSSSENGTGSSQALTSTDNGFWLGDSITIAMNSNAFLKKQKVVAENGYTAANYYNESKKVDKTDKFPKSGDVNYVFVLLGINNPVSSYQKGLLKKLISMYPGKPIFVGEVLPVSKEYKNAKDLNSKVKTYNSDIKKYCESNKDLYYISDTTKGLVKDGYLDTKLTVDGLNLKKDGCKTLANNIKDAILKIGATLAGGSSTDTGSDSSGSTSGDYTAEASYINKYAYISNKTSNTKFYSKADTASTVLNTFSYGKEAYILGVSGIFYKCRVSGITGYIRAKNLTVITKNTFGSTDSRNIGAPCKLLPGTRLYISSSLGSPEVATYSGEVSGKVISPTFVDWYRVEIGNNRGWVKAYRCIINSDPIARAVLRAKDTDQKDGNSGDAGEETNDGVFVELKNGDFDNSDLSAWKKEGSPTFSWKANPEWGEEGHWPYRGDGYVRIRNKEDKLAGIKTDFSIDDTKKALLRVLFYVKPVTKDDETDAASKPETLLENGINVKLLDSNNKVKHEKQISLTELPTTTWSRVGCVFSNITDKKFTLLIGNKKKFDLYIDEVTIEKLRTDEVDEEIGDSDSSSGLVNSGLGATSIDNGGVMVYTVGKPSNANAIQPSIKTVITQAEYDEIMKYSTAANINNYTNSFEPYDKDLDIAKTVGVTADSRLDILTEKINTFTENLIRYKVVETGPGSVDHCVKPVDELNVLFKASDCKVDPIYPDLVIPPKYTTSTYDVLSKNSIPLTTVEDATISIEDSLDKSYSYDYKLLEKKTKKSTGKPVNYYDPYPYDDKIADLENHYPKVLIDEVESRVYSCNHPGCPIAHPMAKNFAMLNDMAINQSKFTEQRLVRIENTLSTMVRYLGRMSSRVNINCVYYGGQTVLGKYKCIRCLHDNRVHDGAIVSMDQCLTCTRYEPIIGQIYDILDETGFNGSAILDDMQMSYMNLDDMKNLNEVGKRTTSYSYIDTNKKEKKKPEDLIEKWKKEDKDAKVKKIKKDITNKKKQEEAINALQPDDYLFMMDWTEESVDLQQPDVKVYPTEKIAAKYKNQKGDPGEKGVASAEESTQMGVSKKTYDTIASGEWVDTRETDDSIQLNKYTSLDFYFENFNLNRTGYEYDNGLKGNIGLNYEGGQGSIDSSVNGTGAAIRKKIIEYAYKVVEENKKAKATYCNSPRTVDPDKPQIYKGTRNGCKNPVCYDCSSLVSSAYRYAGLKSFYNKNCAGGSLVAEAIKNGGQIWLADKAGFEKAIPGDIIMVTNSKIGKFNPKNPPSTHHVMIYTAKDEVSHASGNYEPGRSIRKQSVAPTGNYYSGYMFFIRCKELIDADKAAATNESGSGVQEKAGTIDGVNYIMALKGSKCTQYKEGEGGYNDALGNRLYSSKCNTVASHNLPYGTKVYIPYFKGKQTANPSCIFTVTDTGNAGFDFDICCPASVYYDTKRMDVYVTQWGSGKGVSKSQTYAYKHFPVSTNMWKDYVKNGGTTYKVTKFCKDDADITTKDFWTKYK